MGTPFRVWMWYAPESPSLVTTYDPSQLDCNFPVPTSVVFLKTLMRTKDPSRKNHGRVLLLY